MKAVVLHHTLNSGGGETSFTIETINSLSKLGYDIELITVQKPNLELIKKRYGKIPTIKKMRYVSPFSINYFGLYQKLLTTISSLHLEPSDIVINTNGNSLPFNIPSNILCILYIHFPAFLQTSPEYSNDKYKKSLFWEAYFKPYKIMTHLLTKRAVKRSDIIFTNSHFTKKAIKKAYPAVDPRVIYPPIDLERFAICFRSNSREKQVLVISRFSPEKQIEKAILIAKTLKNTKFVILGNLSKANQPYFKHLNNIITESGLTSRIKLIPNAENDEMINAMSTSMVYLHTMNGEHFGISIVEAMAAGLVPVVPSYGGCSEIVPLENLYTNIKEASYCISKNLEEYDNKKRQFVHAIARQFSIENFRKNMQYFIEQAYEKNNILQKSHSFNTFR